MAKKLVTTTIGDGFASNPDDVSTIRTALDGLGYTDPNPDFGYIDSNLDKNIRSFQDDNDLKVDGIIHPGGETEAAIADAIDDSDDGSFEDAGARSPRFKCLNCPGLHGGVTEDNLCPSCHTKDQMENGHNDDDSDNPESEDIG